MITNLELVNFKCFSKVNLSLKPLTFLCGLNGMGKSSLIQSLLMVRQTWHHDVLRKKEIMLNGSLVHLGEGKDVLYEGASEDIIKINISKNDKSFKLNITYDPNKDSLEIINDIDLSVADSIFENSFQYLRAERLGPRLTSAKEDYPVTREQNIGLSGEFAAHYMLIYGENKIPKKLIHERAVSDTLKANVEAWLSEVSPGVQVTYTDHDQIDQVSTRFNFVGESAKTNDYRSTNVGFGLSYTLPVLVSLLSAKPDSLVIVENPEAHLHPKGQRKIGELIARASSIGAQIIVETHSDHVLNGIRLATKLNVIKPSDCVFHYFDRVSEDRQFMARVRSPIIDADGRFSEWPEGFFDEWDLALTELL